MLVARCVSVCRSSSGNEAQNQMTHSRAQNLPPVYQAPAQRSTGLTVTGNPSLGLPRMSHQPTIKPAQPVNLRYSQASAQPPSAIATSRPASFYPSAGTPAARPQGSYSYPTNNPQQRVQTGGQPGIGGYESRPPLSNSSLCPSYPPVTTPGYPPVTTPSLPRQALGSQPAAQNGRPVYTQAPGYNISHSTGQQRPQAVNMAQNSSAIRPSTARSVPLHLERARYAAKLCPRLSDCANQLLMLLSLYAFADLAHYGMTKIDGNAEWLVLSSGQYACSIT